MDSDDGFKNDFNTVKELVLDEEKIVTYVSLSKDLCVHVNTGKKILHGLIDNIREENPKIKLNVSYVISGIIDDNQAWTTVCSEDELKKLRLSFKTIFFEHIYSVSKGVTCVDRNAYLLLNSFADLNLCKGLIKSNECNKRTSDEIESLKTISQESVTLPSENKQLAGANKIKLESKQLKSKEVHIIPSKEIEKPAIKVKNEVISPKKEPINFKPSNNHSNGHKTQKGIVGFFNKTNGVTAKKTTKDLKNGIGDIAKDENKVEDQKMDVDDIESKSELPLPAKKEIIKKNNVLSQIKKNSKVDKKRKRVLHVSDSDSDAENDPFVDKQELNPESDDEIPPTPSNNNIKITSGIVNPKKRRKVVDKTYTDEDGYILTKKEEVYESCSENEEEIQIKEDIKPIKEEKNDISPREKKNGPKLSKKKISPPQKGKQSTLTNFFKKM
ncbi:unnamed protein product, partial [Brenthis ino]